MKRNPEIEAIYLTTQEEEDALYEGKVAKFFHQRAVKNGSWAVSDWDAKNREFGQDAIEENYRRPRQNDFKKPMTEKDQKISAEKKRDDNDRKMILLHEDKEGNHFVNGKKIDLNVSPVVHDGKYPFIGFLNPSKK